MCNFCWAKWQWDKFFTYTVHILSFRTGIIKSICVKEMTLLLSRFWHMSLLTVQTDLHGHTASGYLCRSRPLQWYLMYLSRLSGCPKLSQRDTPSSGISLLGTKSNQQVLNLANMEGGQAQQLLFNGPKTAWWLSCVKTMVVIFFNWQGIIHKEFVPEGETINAVYYKGVMERLLDIIWRVRLGMCESGDWFILHDNAPFHNATIIKWFLAQWKVTVLDHPPYLPALAPADYLLFPKVKSHLKGRLFDSISDIQKAVTSTLNTITKNDFYKGIQKLYDRTYLCVQLEGMYVEN